MDGVSSISSSSRGSFSRFASEVHTSRRRSAKKMDKKGDRRGGDV